MKFLCLHGAIGNAANFEIQLDAVERELASDGTATFKFIDGQMNVLPPAGFENYFGIGPHWRWFDDSGLGMNSMMTRVRVLPTGDSPEDIMRALRDIDAPDSVVEQTGHGIWKNRIPLMEYLYATLEANPDIQGVIGYSEGASLAASLILDEQQRARIEGRTRQLKCAMFLTGWPPISPDAEAILAYESSVRVDVPTLHIVGANDPYKCGALLLFNTCVDDQAMLFDTGKGHIIPSAGPVIKELGDSIRAMIGMAGIMA